MRRNDGLASDRNPEAGIQKRESPAYAFRAFAAAINNRRILFASASSFAPHSGSPSSASSQEPTDQPPRRSAACPFQTCILQCNRSAACSQSTARHGRSHSLPPPTSEDPQRSKKTFSHSL